MPTAPQQTTRMAIICVVSFVAINAVFYFLSGSYFDSHRDLVPGVGSVPTYSPDQAMHVRVTFGVFAGVVAAAGFGAGMWPRVTGHLIPTLLGVGHLIAAVAVFIHGAPSVLPMTLFVSGVLMPVLAGYSLRGSRAAWAFLVALCGVFAVVELFGAPKLRGALDIGLWITMILPGLNAVATAALASLRGDYVERAPA